MAVLAAETYCCLKKLLAPNDLSAMRDNTIIAIEHRLFITSSRLVCLRDYIMAVCTISAGALHLRHCYSHVHSLNHSLYLSAKG